MRLVVYSLEAANVKALSPAWVHVSGYLSWGLSLEDQDFYLVYGSEF